MPSCLHHAVNSSDPKDTLRMEIGHSSQYGRCAILFLVDLSFGGALRGCGAHDLVTKAFAYISLSLNIYARPPDSLSEMLFDLSDTLVALVC